jgi:hypothetical protein
MDVFHTAFIGRLHGLHRDHEPNVGLGVEELGVDVLGVVPCVPEDQTHTAFEIHGELALCPEVEVGVVDRSVWYRHPTQE